MGDADKKAVVPAKGGDDFEPYDQRIVAKPMSDIEATIQLVKCALGTGCLAMPMAFHNAGYVSAILSTVIIGIIVVYAMQVLIKAMHKICVRRKVPYLTFRQSMETALMDGPKALRWFSKTAGIFCDVFLSLYHFGVCSVYVVFIADTQKALMDYYVKIDHRLHMVILIIPLALAYSIRNLKHLVPFSSVANFLLIAGYLILMGVMVFDLPPLSQRTAFHSLETYALFLGTVLFALEAVGVMISIEANMKTPKHFVGWFGTLNQGMPIVVAIYLLMGFLGYWKYGSDVKGSISLNMKQTPLMQMLKGLLGVAIFLSYPLQGYVPVDVIWNQHLSKGVDESRVVLYELLFRYLIVVLTVLTGIVFPNFDLFLSLVGSFCLSFLGLIFPAFLDICTRHAEREGYGKLRIHLWVDLFILLFGIIGGAAGTYCSISNIIKNY